MSRTKYDNEFKVMIVELLNSGIKTEQVGNDYGLNISMISRWKREYKSKLGDFSKKRVLSAEEQELKALKYKTKAQDSTLLGDVDRAFDKKDWGFINDPRSIEFRIYEEVVLWHYLIHQGFIPAYYGLIVLSEELILAIENELLYLKQ